MKKLVFAALMLGASPAVAANLFQADFTGAINGGDANVKPPFRNNGFTQGMPFSGTFVYDASLIPGTGTVNVGLPTTSDDGAIPPAEIFKLNFGPLTFTFADATAIAPAVQYKNGAFNGFVYVSEFSFANNWYQLRLEGTVLGVKLLTNVAAPGAPHGFVTGSNLINGHIDLGLTNIRPYETATPGVPEPASWAMMIGGFALAGMALRRHQRPAMSYS